MQQPVPVLMLVMEFAPVNTTGNYRALKFVKYLRQFNIEPIVVTLVAEQASQYFGAAIDEGLLQDVPEQTAIYRAPCKPPRKYWFNRAGNFLKVYFSIADDLRTRWMPGLEAMLDEIIVKHRPLAVFTSLPPFSSGKLGVYAARKYNLPLVLDMRDLWAFFGSTPLNSKLHFKAMLKQESAIFESASAVLGVTPQMLSIISRSHPGLPQQKLHLIPNGFDFDINGILPMHFPGGKQSITIGYIGSFYYYPAQRSSMMKPWWKKPPHRMLEYAPEKQDWLYRSPYFFLRSMNALFKAYPEYKNRIRIAFIGKIPGWLSGMIEEFELQDNFQAYGFLPNSEAVKLAAAFDLMLATSEKITGGEHYCLPSKIFDYIALRKPVLAYVTPGIQRTFFEESGTGMICDPDDTDAVTAALHTLFTEGRTFTPAQEYLQTYHRRNITARLAEVFRLVIQPS